MPFPIVGHDGSKIRMHTPGGIFYYAGGLRRDNATALKLAAGDSSHSAIPARRTHESVLTYIRPDQVRRAEVI